MTQVFDNSYMRSNTKSVTNKWFVTVFPDTHPWTFPERLPAGVKCIKGQMERCPSTGRTHYHVYIYLGQKEGYRWIQKNIFNDQPVNCQVPKNDVAAERYSVKDSTRIAGPWQLGEIPNKKCNMRTFFPGDTQPVPSDNSQKLMNDIERWKRNYTPYQDSNGWYLLTPEENDLIMSRLINNMFYSV